MEWVSDKTWMKQLNFVRSRRLRCCCCSCCCCWCECEVGVSVSRCANVCCLLNIGNHMLRYNPKSLSPYIQRKKMYAYDQNRINSKQMNETRNARQQLVSSNCCVRQTCLNVRCSDIYVLCMYIRCCCRFFAIVWNSILTYWIDHSQNTFISL